MKKCLILITLLAVFTGGQVGADTKPPAQHAFFKLLKGKWKTEGELKGTDDVVHKYSAEWEGVVREDGSFVMEGTREIGDNTTQQYRWTFNTGAGEGLYEATHEIINDTGSQQRFEVSTPEAVMGMEITAFVGSGNAKVTLKETFVDDANKKLQTEFSVQDDQGNVTLSATLINVKQDEP